MKGSFAKTDNNKAIAIKLQLCCFDLSNNNLTNTGLIY